MRAVNLLPREEQRPPREGARTALLVLAGGVAAVTAALGVLAHSASATADDRRAELAAVEAAIAELPEASAPAVSQDALAQQRANRLNALSVALRTRVPFDRLMRELSLVLPEDSWLIGITAASPTEGVADPSASPEGSGEVTIQGATYSHDAVARVLARLSALPSLQNVRLGASALVEAPSGTSTQGSRTSGQARPVVTFTIVASVPSRGAS